MSYSLPPPRGVRAVLYRQCVLGEHYSYVARIPGSPLWAARAVGLSGQDVAVFAGQGSRTLCPTRALEGVSSYATEVLGGLSRAARVAGAKTYE